MKLWRVEKLKGFLRSPESPDGGLKQNPSGRKAKYV